MSETPDLSRLPTVDGPRAPMVYFDGVRGLFHANGVVGATLTAMLVRGGPSDTTEVDQAVMAHLRCNVEGAKFLRRALDQAILMAEAVDTGARD